MASYAVSFVRQQSHELPFSSSFIISTSATVVFSNPFCCIVNSDTIMSFASLLCTTGKEITRPNLANTLFISLVFLNCGCCRIVTLSFSWHDLTTRITPCIVFLSLKHETYIILWNTYNIICFPMLCSSNRGGFQGMINDSREPDNFYSKFCIYNKKPTKFDRNLSYYCSINLRS